MHVGQYTCGSTYVRVGAANAHGPVHVWQYIRACVVDAARAHLFVSMPRHQAVMSSCVLGSSHDGISAVSLQQQRPG